MLLQWLVGLIAVAALIIAWYSDALTGKNKHSLYFQTVQKPVGKAERDAIIPEPNQHDGFFSKLNSL